MLLDELMPEPDVSAHYEAMVNANPERTFIALQQADFSQSRIIRALMGLRTLGRTRRSGTQQDLIERMRKAGFIELARKENEEIVIGVVGRFWQPKSGILLGLSAQEILDFSTLGFAKAFWNFHLASNSPEQTLLFTETRVQLFGPAARRKFRLYWSLVGPFSGWIRKEMLRLIRKQAEQSKTLSG
jgi:hypothetical protein